MKNVYKTSIFQLNLEQIEIIEKYIKKCVTLIKDNFVEKSDDWLHYNYTFDLDIDVIDELVKIFHESKLFYKQSVDIAKQYDDISKDLSLYNDPEIFRVVYPVLFFTLIMKNELNRETINSRLERKTKSWGNTRDVFQVSSWETDTVIEPEDFINMRNGLTEQEDRIMRISNRSLSQQKNLECIQRAKTLLDYKEIIYTETSAKIGLFVGSILKYIYRIEKNDRNNSTANIDTILRLFLLNGFYGIISDAGIWSNGMISLVPKDDLLTECYTERGVCPQTIMDEGEWEDFSILHDLIQLGKPAYKIRLTINITNSEDPKNLYSQLSQLPTFTDDDIEEILDYYFADKTLKWYTEYYLHIKNHIFQIIQAAKDNNGLIWDDHELEKLYALTMAECTNNLHNLSAIGRR